MKLHWQVAVAAVIVAFSATRASAQAGALDPAFGVGGRVMTDFLGSDLANTVAIQADGKIVVAGSNDSDDFALARYDPDGSLDETFGTLGRVINDFGGDEYAWAVRIAAGGQIIAAGTSEFSDFLVVRYSPDGSLDSAFGTGGRTITDFGGAETLEAVAIQPADGKIVAVGDAFNNTTLFAGLALARYNANGSLDLGFGAGGKVLTPFSSEIQAHGIAIQTDGKIVIAGFIFPASTTDYVLARYDANGTLDSTFGAGGIAVIDFGDDEYAFGMAIQPDGRIVAAGGSGFDFAVARFNADGTPDLTFGAGGQSVTDFGGSDLASSLAIQANGKIVLAGRTRPPGGADDFALARYNPDGSIDTTFGTGGQAVTDFTVAGSPGEAFAYSSANGVAIQADGNIVAAGYAWTGEATADDDFALARYIGGNTPAGSNIVVVVDGVTVSFQSVSQPGDTTVAITSSGLAPDGFSVGNPPTYFDISTTAIFSGSAQVCLDYTGVAFVDETSIQLMHFDGTAWANVTTSLDTLNDVICGSVTSLSPFVIVEPSSVPVVSAAVDVTPDVLKKAAKGSYVTVYIEFPSGAANPAAIDVSTIRLSAAAGEVAVAAGWAAVIGDANGNGVIDLTVKFDRATVQSWFTAPTLATLRVTGRLTNGTEFEGEDVVRVIDR